MNASETFRKLKLDDTKKILIVNAPADYLNAIKGMTYATHYDSADKGSYDFVQIFGTTQAEMKLLVGKNGDAIKYDGLFWLCYPKGGGKIKSDLKRDIMWEFFSIAGLRPVAQIAIDETWSALRGRPSELVGK